ncbi:MAG: 3'-5' exonuclease [Candidatus Methanomethyliaceae archaeon]|nr:3'-5' exonuclease [Candidatus Methanomethyliaceae archaeon]
MESTEFAVLDLETTGLDVKMDEIISIAIIPMTGLQIHFGKSFYSLIKPKKFHERTIKIHGICRGDLDQAPTFEMIFEKIFGMLNNRIIVGFNVIFDIAFLKESAKKLQKNHHKKFELKYLDIKEIEGLILLRAGIPVTPFIDFSDLLHKYQIEGTSRHNALSDAYIAARIFQKQLNALLEFKITLDDLEMMRRMQIF